MVQFSKPLQILLLSVFSFGLVASCAAPPPPRYTVEDVQSAADTGSLAMLYDQMKAELSDPTLTEEQQASLELRVGDAGRRLAQDSEREIRASLDASELPSGLVPLQAYDAQEARLEQIKGWNPGAYQQVAADVTKGRKTTQDVIAAKKAEVAELGEDRVTEKLAAYEELGMLYGPGTDEQREYAAQRDEVVDALRVEATRALANEDYSDAQRMLAIVAAVDPTDASVEGDLVEIDAKLFEQRFYEALERDKPDDAYQALITLAQAPNFDKVRPRLEDSGDVMAEYFVALGAGATESGDVIDAYRWFGQARDIRSQLGLANPTQVQEEQPFIAEMHRRFEIADSQKLHGLAWGYLNVINALEPGAPVLRRELRETREKVLQKAVKRLSAATFEDTNRSGGEFGDTVTAKIVQYLFENLPDDVRIIEREKLAAIETERGFSKDRVDLMAVDFLIQGNILEAKVDVSKHPQKKRFRVVTERETVPNPDWVQWNGMTEKERKKAGLTQPTSATMVVERKEDISIDVTFHRKVGVFSVSYRVIDADTAKVLFADTQRVKREVEDSSSDGVELGDFKQEFKVANLPSDVEILGALADEVSGAVGAKLAGVFANPESRYADDAARFVREGNYIDASQQYAYAVVLTDRKDLDATALRRDLQSAAVAAVLD
jgi:hypothetical protein